MTRTVTVLRDRLSKAEETIVIAHVETLAWDKLGSEGYVTMTSGRRIRLKQECYDRVRRALTD